MKTNKNRWELTPKRKRKKLRIETIKTLRQITENSIKNQRRRETNCNTGLKKVRREATIIKTAIQTGIFGLLDIGKPSGKQYELQVVEE